MRHGSCGATRPDSEPKLTNLEANQPLHSIWVRAAKALWYGTAFDVLNHHGHTELHPHFARV